MTRDLNTLMHWLRFFLIVAAIFSTSFPVLYLFSPWWSTSVGRVLMLQSISLALALDVTVLFQYWHPKDILVLFWVNTVIFGLIAFASGALTWLLWRTNYTRHNLRREDKRSDRAEARSGGNDQRLAAD